MISDQQLHIFLSFEHAYEISFVRMFLLDEAGHLEVGHGERLVEGVAGDRCLSRQRARRVRARA